jgi:hypothetical protein
MPMALGWFLGVAALASAAPPSSDQLQAWVRELDAEEYSVREAASSHLIAAGEPAIDMLAAGVASSSPEAAWRAGAALEQIALHSNEAALLRVAGALDRLSQGSRPGLDRIANELRTKQAQIQRDRAMTKIRALGGKLPGEESSAADSELPLGEAIPRLLGILGDEADAVKIAEPPAEAPRVDAAFVRVGRTYASLAPQLSQRLARRAPPTDFQSRTRSVRH